MGIPFLCTSVLCTLWNASVRILIQIFTIYTYTRTHGWNYRQYTVTVQFIIPLLSNMDFNDKLR